MFVFLRADVNAFDNFQWTALHHASHAGEVSVNLASSFSDPLPYTLLTYYLLVKLPLPYLKFLYPLFCPAKLFSINHRH